MKSGDEGDGEIFILPCSNGAVIGLPSLVVE